MKQLGGLRKAYASRGDDATFTRWIKDEPARKLVEAAEPPMNGKAFRRG
jgi:hypothetical protein